VIDGIGGSYGKRYAEVVVGHTLILELLDKLALRLVVVCEVGELN
jgi:hypothetical protein